MERFKIATVQMNALKDDLQHNLDVHARFIEEAAEAGCALVEFPEVATTAHYGHPDVTRFAEPAGDGPVYSLIADRTKKFGIIASYGFAEKSNGTFYNAQALVGPNGLIGIQHKMHASGDEYYVFRMGRSFKVFDLGFCKVGTLICYDTSFSESWRMVALQGAEVVLAPHAGRKGGLGKEASEEQQLKNLQTHREEMPGSWGVYAKENGVFCAHCGQFGFNGHSTHKGGTFIVDPTGEMLAQGPLLLEDLMITAELDPDVLQKARMGGGCTLRTRRPEFYGKLTEAI